MEENGRPIRIHVEAMNRHATVPDDAAALMSFMARSTIALDGLWFRSVIGDLGRARALELDKEAFATLFRLATRIWSDTTARPSSDILGRASVFRAIAYLFGHDAIITSDEQNTSMSIRRCGVYEALRAAGLTDQHDCSKVCSYIAPRWFDEIDPARSDASYVDLKIPLGEGSCDWVITKGEHEER